MGVLANNILEGEGHFYLDRVPNDLARIVVDSTEKVSSKYIHDKQMWLVIHMFVSKKSYTIYVFCIYLLQIINANKTIDKEAEDDMIDTVKDIFSKVLDVDSSELGQESDFFELGGSSLDTIALISHIESSVGIRSKVLLLNDSSYSSSRIQTPDNMHIF